MQSKQLPTSPVHIPSSALRAFLGIAFVITRGLILVALAVSSGTARLSSQLSATLKDLRANCGFPGVTAAEFPRG